MQKIICFLNFLGSNIRSHFQFRWQQIAVGVVSENVANSRFNGLFDIKLMTRKIDSYKKLTIYFQFWQLLLPVLQMPLMKIWPILVCTENLNACLTAIEKKC